MAFGINYLLDWARRPKLTSLVASASSHAAGRVSFENAAIANSPAAMACISWLSRNATEATLTLRNADDSVVESHPVLDLLREPGDGWSQDELLKATVYSLAVSGNAYWLILRRGGGGAPVGLRYLSHDDVKVSNLRRSPLDAPELIYTVDGGPGMATVLNEDIVHLRLGRDPYENWLGLPPLRSAMPDIYCDAEAYQYSASVLSNRGVPGVVVSPDPRTQVRMEQAQVEQFKQLMKDTTTSLQRGESVVFGMPMRVAQLAALINDMVVRDIHNRAEERICATLGLQPAVLGLGAGLEQTKVGATLTVEARQAWVNTLIPWLRTIAHDLTSQLLSAITAEEGLRFVFDTTDVPAAREDELRQTQILATQVQNGLRTANEARTILGEPEHIDGNVLAPVGGGGRGLTAAPAGEDE